jgi:hypothetical protein
MITLIDNQPVLKLAADATFDNAAQVYAYLHDTYADPADTAVYVLGPVRVLRFSSAVYYKGYAVNFPWQAVDFFRFAHHVPGTDVIEYCMAESGRVYVWNAVLPGTSKTILAVGRDAEEQDNIVTRGVTYNREEMINGWTFNPETVRELIMDK